MGLRTLNPTTPGVRGRVAPDFAELTQGNKPLKALTGKNASPGGRNHFGRITSRFRGGGHKQRFRVIDFRRDKIGVPAKVASIEYDPNRSSRIVLLNYADGEKRYILWPVGLKLGDTVLSSREADIKPGNSLPLRYIPLGTTIHNVCLHVAGKAQLVRSAGDGAQLMAKEGDWGQVRLPLGRSAQGAPRLPRDRWSDRQRRAQQRSSWQSWSHPLEGIPSTQPRRHDEPRRSPHGRWRRSFVRWSPPLLAVGTVGEGPQDP